MRELTEGEVAAMRAYRSDAELGRKVRELLASEEPPEGLVRHMHGDGFPSMPAGKAWSWFRQQLLGDELSEAAENRKIQEDMNRVGLAGSLATGGAVGEDDGR